MIARCKNSPHHKKFVTVTHVTEDWIVDQNGDFIEIFENSETEVVHGPNKDNVWTCVDCGCEAKVTYD